MELQDVAAPTTTLQLDEQSPKTPTLSRKLKAISLDSEVGSRKLRSGNSAAFSVPNTPKKLTRCAMRDLFDADSAVRGTNLKRFASNTSISGSQTLKTLPEIMMLQDFSGSTRVEPVRIKAKGLLERRGSNASLTIDLGTTDAPPASVAGRRSMQPARSMSTLNFAAATCAKCIIYEATPSEMPAGHLRNCALSARKSISNENLYAAPSRGRRRAQYPRQTDVEHALSDDFRLQLQNVQYLQTAGSVLSIADLRSLCEMPRVPQLHQEFWEVPLNLQEKCIVSGSQSRNRYRGILPNEHSRVHLVEHPQAYIHANYIKGPDYSETAFIATQGPMAHTCDDFWQMVWQSNAECIVMLTQLVEKRRNKCELYFPEEHVKLRQTRIVRHFWFTCWQDHKMAEPAEVLGLAQRVLAAHSVGGVSPLVVHCSAGIGRTGCFLAILNGIEQLRRNANVDVLAILCALRLNRGGMVQTAEQYELIHRVLALYVEQMALVARFANESGALLVQSTVRTN